MACRLTADQCREQDIAARLRDAKKTGTDYEATCPVCGHGGFRVSKPTRSHYRHIWACACKRCKCDPAAVRAALLTLGIMPGCLGDYGTLAKASTDPNMAARLEAAARDIIAAPGLRPSDMRIVLAEALGAKVPGDKRAFVKWAQEIGIGRRQAYEAADRHCRLTDVSPSPGGGVEDQS